MESGSARIFVREIGGCAEDVKGRSTHGRLDALGRQLSAGRSKNSLETGGCVGGGGTESALTSSVLR